MAGPQRIPVQRRRTIQAEVIMRPKDPSRLFALRDNRDLSQRDLAERVGCSQTMIHYLETGKTGAKKPLAQKLSKEFGVPMEELFEVPRAVLVHAASDTPGTNGQVA
jgi:transcriptional regulator with XRE-family HTH domain